ncbi:hypothetical protein HanPI659440_Chr10g0372121 [Helianthus annuus]|nr:hypothetical protein HanPI659440_Chr10g0372121 [Helianthus annuus]
MGHEQSHAAMVSSTMSSTPVEFLPPLQQRRLQRRARCGVCGVERQQHHPTMPTPCGLRMRSCRYVSFTKALARMRAMFAMKPDTRWRNTTTNKRLQSLHSFLTFK